MEHLFKPGYLKFHLSLIGFLTGFSIVLSAPDMVFEKFSDRALSILELPIVYKSSKPPDAT
jgi:nitrate reductase gamma subunit